MLARLIPDRFILWLLATVALAGLAPVAGRLAEAVDALTLAAIFALFFLHGVRLPREAVLAGIADARLHLAILALTFAAFPVVGLGLANALPGMLAPEMWIGLLFLCALPSTVQSSIAYTSIARGNVAGAVTAAAFSNLLGVFLTPLIVTLILEAEGAQASASGVLRIVALLLLPFLLGHVLRPRLFRLVALRPGLTILVDKGTILLAVYGAFSAATVDGIWTRLPPGQLGLLGAALLVLLALVIAAAWALGRIGGFRYEDRAAILFCGSVKSLASGVPMARILFPGPAAGLVLVPVMLFHILQLIVSAWIAGILARRAAPEQDG